MPVVGVHRKRGAPGRAMPDAECRRRGHAMLLTVREFRERVSTDLPALVDDLSDLTGRGGESERRAWQRSLPRLTEALTSAALEDVHVHFARRDEAAPRGSSRCFRWQAVGRRQCGSGRSHRRTGARTGEMAARAACGEHRQAASGVAGRAVPGLVRRTADRRNSRALGARAESLAGVPRESVTAVDAGRRRARELAPCAYRPRAGARASRRRMRRHPTKPHVQGPFLSCPLFVRSFDVPPGDPLCALYFRIRRFALMSHKSIYSCSTIRVPLGTARFRVLRRLFDEPAGIL